MVHDYMPAKSKFRPEFTEDIYRLKKECYTDKSIYDSWGITHETFYRWLREKSKASFYEAYKRGMDESRLHLAQLAKSRLAKLVEGYEYTEVHTTTKLGFEEVKKITKHMQPNVTAVIFTLSNTDKENFTQRPTQETTNNIHIDGTKYERINTEDDS